MGAGGNAVLEDEGLAGARAVPGARSGGAARDRRRPDRQLRAEVRMRTLLFRRSRGRCFGGSRGLVVFSAVVAALVAGGCGSSDGGNGPTAPVGLALNIGSPRLQVARSTLIEAVYLYPILGRQEPECTWYVNGTEGGDPETVGTITQTNPAAYTAPPTPPPGGEVEISAVDRENASFTAADTISVVFTIRYVDAEDGNDVQGGGAWTQPLRTITFALAEIASGDTVLVLPGTYDPDHGETGGYTVPAGAALAGTDRDSCMIYADGAQYATVTIEDGATVRNLTIGNWSHDSNGILSRGGGLISDIAISEPFDFAAIRADGSDMGRANDVVIENCLLVNLVSPGTERAMELVNGTHCEVRGCTMTGWQYGAYVNGTSDPLIEGCTITDNTYGVATASSGGVHTLPDLGGGARGSSGGNTIQDNGFVGLLNGTPATIYAIGNTWNSDPPEEFSDYLNTAGGTVVLSR